jgi:hypothetical protein
MKVTATDLSIPRSQAKRSFRQMPTDGERSRLLADYVKTPIKRQQ